MFTLQIDYTSPVWERLPGDVRTDVRQWMETLTSAPDKGLTRWMKDAAARLGVSYGTVSTKYYAFRNSGGDWSVLINQTKAKGAIAPKSRTRQPVFIAELLRIVEKHQRNNTAAFRYLRRLWQARIKPIPGYEDWPEWPQIPCGWTSRNLSRIVAENTNAARLASIRIRTSSKTNLFLPTVLTTRCGLHPGAVIQLDDVWHDNIVTYGKNRRPVRVLELGALDLFSACRFHWGARPRRRNATDTGYEGIAGSDMRLFIAELLHGTGYSPQGTSFMSEHATAKISEDIARILCDATRGIIRVDYQPIEGKQAALSGFWSGTEGGNFRAKAYLESTHNLIHNDLAALPMQTGSPSSGLKGPVTTDRIVAYINRVLKAVAEKAPHRLDQLRLPTWDFHTQFVPFLIDYYDLGLDSRTDQTLEGWEKLNHVVNEYTTAPGTDPGTGHFISERQFLALPDASRQIISAAAQADPQSWSRRRNLSPKEVWNNRPKFLPVPPTVLCDILGADLAREVTAARGFLTFSDQEISADPLVYVSRYCAGPNQGREIPHGEKISMFVMPFDDATAIIVDAKQRYLGQVPLYKRVQPLDTSAFGSEAPFAERPDMRTAEFKRAAGEKHERIATTLQPSRILHAHDVQEAQDIREHNRKVIHGDEIAETRRILAEGRHTVSAGLMADEALSHIQPHTEPSHTDDLDF
jgi:hypothetical protein